MKNRDWEGYFRERLAEAEKELAGFKNAVEKHGLRVRTRDTVNGERDITDQQLRDLESTVEEYRAVLRDE